MNSDNAPDAGPVDYAVKEYNRILDEARRGERPFDHEATLRALAEKTGLTVEELRKAIPSPAGG